MSNKHPQSINDLPESLRRKIHHEAAVESSKEQEVVMNQQNKTERWVEEFDKEIQKIREEIEEQRLELVEMNDCDGNVCECETGYDVAETYKCKHCAWIVFNDSNLKSFISQLLSDARREERERCLEALPKKKSIVGITTEPEGNLVQDMVNLRALSQVESFNEAIDQAIHAISNKKDK